MKSLTITSCHPGGKKIKNEFDITSKFNNQAMEKLTYPIILQGSTLATVSTTSGSNTILPPFDQHYDLSNYIYIQQKKYGPYKKPLFIQFFNFLNEATTSSTPSYIEAINLFAQVYEPNPQTFTSNNYALIKFPHTSWFTPGQFKKLVFNLSQIAALTKSQITIPQETQAILMDANYVPAHILLTQDKIPSFIPINYLNQNYVFETITTAQNMTLKDFINQFFTIKRIQEPINIVIKRLMLGSQEYSNIYIFIHKELWQLKGIKDGYIFTNSTNKTFIVHSAYNSDDKSPQITEPYKTTSATSLISSVIQSATKQFEPSTKITGKYAIEISSQTPSKKSIKKLQKTIATQQKQDNISPKVQDMINRSRQQYENEQNHIQQKPALIKA